jgi:hypothetical protein
MKAYRLILSLMASRRAGLLANNTCCLREVRPDTADARIDAHRPATDRLGPEWRIPLYEL